MSSKSLSEKGSSPSLGGAALSPALLLGHVSQRICSLVAPWIQRRRAPNPRHSLFQTGSKLSPWKWTLGLTLLAPGAAVACEPIIPMMMIYGGPGIASRSLFWLGIAVGVKCLAFAFLERSVSRRSAFFAMLFGNFMSSIAGLMLALAFTSGPAFLIFVPLMCLLARSPGKRLSTASPWPRVRRVPPGSYAWLLPMALIASLFLFGMASAVLESRNYALYWALKILYVTLGLGISLLVTAAFEEWGVWICLRERAPDREFYKPVLRANYVTFFLIFLVLALKALPRRMESPNFLIYWQDLVALLG